MHTLCGPLFAKLDIDLFKVLLFAGKKKFNRPDKLVISRNLVTLTSVPLIVSIEVTLLQ